MLPCANLLVLPFVLMTCKVSTAKENDTAVVGSLVHETKVKAPTDLLSAGSKKYKKSFEDDFADDDFKNSHHKGGDKDNYNKYNTFHSSDGDGYGYSQSYAFSDKDNGKKNKKGDDDFTSFDDDEDEAADSVSPKFTELHFDKGASSVPTSSYRFQSGDGDQFKGKLVGPDFDGYGGSSKSKRMKRKKDNVQPSAATEYDNYDYADVEEPDEAPADFEAEEAPDPEYGSPVYADQGDAYDYY